MSSRFLADDREVIALAEILVKSDIAAVEDWEKSGRDATKYLLLTLQRWIRDHGGASIERRFDLDLTLSDRLVDYSDERGPEGTLYLIVDPDGAAFVLLNPAIELLGEGTSASAGDILQALRGITQPMGTGLRLPRRRRASGHAARMVRRRRESGAVRSAGH